MMEETLIGSFEFNITLWNIANNLQLYNIL